MLEIFGYRFEEDDNIIMVDQATASLKAVIRNCIACWEIAQALVNPMKSMWSCRFLLGKWMRFLSWYSSLTRTCRYAKLASRVIKTVSSARKALNMFIRGMGYVSLTVMGLRERWKTLSMLHLPSKPVQSECLRWSSRLDHTYTCAEHIVHFILLFFLRSRSWHLRGLSKQFCTCY